MIKLARLPNNIEDLIPGVVEYFKARQEVCFAYVFGGLARGRPFPLSDADIAIYLKGDVDFLEIKMEMLGALMDLLRTDEIDPVILNRAPLTLRMKILQNKRVIVDKVPFLRHQYESLTMRVFRLFNQEAPNSRKEIFTWSIRPWSFENSRSFRST
jgi:predicted nucleotidyltransferase